MTWGELVRYIGWWLWSLAGDKRTYRVVADMNPRQRIPPFTKTIYGKRAAVRFCLRWIRRFPRGMAMMTPEDIS